MIFTSPDGLYNTHSKEMLWLLVGDYHRTKSHKLIPPVFLRALDYFKGTLFLTTNHSFEIDRAIIDRVSLTVKYQKSNAVRRMLCNNLRNRLILSGYSLSVEVNQELDKLCADMYEWSGREINTGKDLLQSFQAYLYQS